MRPLALLASGFGLIALAVSTLIAAGDGPAAARLVRVFTETSEAGPALLLNTSEPVAYVTTQPDELTVTVDLRNATTSGVENQLVEDGLAPVAGIRIREIEADDGVPVARVDIRLREPASHRVTSARRTIRVEFGQPSSVALPGVPIRLTDADTTPPAVQAVPGRSDSGAAGLSRGGDTSGPSAVSARAGPQQAGGATITLDPLAVLRGRAAGRDPLYNAGELSRRTDTARAPSVEGSRGTSPESPAARAVQSAQPPTQLGTPGERTYTGHPVSFDFQSADLRAVLRAFAEISGLNIVIDPDVQGSVDVVLTDVPWDQALDVILRANQLGYEVEGTVVRIAPLEAFRLEADERRQRAEAEALEGQLQVLTKTLSYARAADLAQLLTRAVLSARGEVQVDERTNTLIISDLSGQLEAASDLIAILDRPEPQVEIEARIVQTSRDFARALGVQWGVAGRVSPELGNTTSLSFPNSGSLTGRAGTDGTAVNLGVTNPTSAIGLALGSVNGAFNLDIAISALESTGQLRVLSSPRVTTQNNVAAEITQGTQIPIQTVANNTVTVSFQDAALTLRVIPRITAAMTVIMDVSVENSTPDFSRAVNGIPPINTQRANTTIQVVSGQTAVIGGVFVSSSQSQNSRTPFLHRIPLLGWLFKNDSVNEASDELLIFLTPHILDQP